MRDTLQLVWPKGMLSNLGNFPANNLLSMKWTSWKSKEMCWVEMRLQHTIQFTSRVLVGWRSWWWPEEMWLISVAALIMKSWLFLDTNSSENGVSMAWRANFRSSDTWKWLSENFVGLKKKSNLEGSKKFLGNCCHHDPLHTFNQEKYFFVPWLPKLTVFKSQLQASEMKDLIQVSLNPRNTYSAKTFF